MVLKLSKGQKEELTQLRWCGRREEALSRRQEEYEYFTNEPSEWAEFEEEGIGQYFAYTSTGKKPEIPHTDCQRMLDLQKYGLNLAITQWKEDIRNGLLIKAELEQSDIPRSLLRKLNGVFPSRATMQENHDLYHARRGTVHGN